MLFGVFAAIIILCVIVVGVINSNDSSYVPTEQTSSIDSSNGLDVQDPAEAQRQAEVERQAEAQLNVSRGLVHGITPNMSRGH